MYSGTEWQTSGLLHVIWELQPPLSMSFESFFTFINQPLDYFNFMLSNCSHNDLLKHLQILQMSSHDSDIIM